VIRVTSTSRHLRYEQTAEVLSFKRGVDPMSTAALASGLTSKKSDNVRFRLSVAIVVIGVAVAIWALAAGYHDFSPDELGLMAALT
jgi:hypothetical protein